MCGGRDACRTRLEEDQIETRRSNGCDEPAIPRARYAILCNRCDGRGCDDCRDGPRRGYKLVKRCPASHLTEEFAGFLRLRAWRSRGAQPFDGTFEHWPVRYVQFVENLEAEIDRIREQEAEAERDRANSNSRR